MLPDRAVTKTTSPAQTQDRGVKHSTHWGLLSPVMYLAGRAARRNFRRRIHPLRNRKRMADAKSHSRSTRNHNPIPELTDILPLSLRPTHFPLTTRMTQLSITREGARLLREVGKCRFSFGSHCRSNPKRPFYAAQVPMTFVRTFCTSRTPVAARS